jgi:hypothetical protein
MIGRTPIPSQNRPKPGLFAPAAERRRRSRRPPFPTASGITRSNALIALYANFAGECGEILMTDDGPKSNETAANR